MKIIVTLCSGIIMTGVAYSLYNAANDYGLATISLPPAITAQNDDTSGDGSSGSGDGTNYGPCDGLEVYCETRLDLEPLTFKKSSNANKEISVLGKTIYTSKAETIYTVLLSYKHCVDVNKPNVCVKDEQGIFLVDIFEGDSTNGDTTSGNH